MNTESPTPRYSQPRTCLNWKKNPQLAGLKMLAWVIYKHEGIRNAEALWNRADALCLPIIGDPLAAVVAQCREEQGADLNAAKLYQRADKTERYLEFTNFVYLAIAAYARYIGVDAETLKESLLPAYLRAS